MRLYGLQHCLETCTVNLRWRQYNNKSIKRLDSISDHYSSLWIICHTFSVSYFIVCLYSYKYSHDCIDLVTLALTYHSTVMSARSGYGMSNLFPSLSLRDILRRVVILGCWGSMKLISLLQSQADNGLSLRLRHVVQWEEVESNQHHHIR